MKSDSVHQTFTAALDALVADMQSVGVWLRALQIYISDSHVSYFTSNLLVVLAELRAALGVLAPAGVGTVTGWD